MTNKSSYILFGFGLIGILLYFFLRPEIDYNGNGAISESATDIEEKLEDITSKLGFSVDSLAMGTFFQQHSHYMELLKDSLGEEITPGKMNEGKAHTQSWVSIIGKKDQLNGVFTSNHGLFEDTGILKFVTNNQGKVIRIVEHEENPNPSFIQADSIEAAADQIVGDILGYPLENYMLVGSALDTGSEFGNEGRDTVTTFQTDIDESKTEITFNWVRKPGVMEGPQTLALSLDILVKEFISDTDFSTRFGYVVRSFVAKNDLEPEELNSGLPTQVSVFDFVLIACALILAIMVFIIGVRNIFNGKVEWRRALVIFVCITLATWGWRSIYFWSTLDEFLNTPGFFSAVLNSLLWGLILGLYAALAYISWEAFARTYKHGQVELLDAFWQRKLFVRESGEAMINGFFVGGILLGVFTMVLYLSDTYFFQSDSQFGFSEASIRPKILTINMTAWSATWLIGFAQIGFVYGMTRHWIKNSWVVLATSVILSSLFLTVLGRIVATPNDLEQDMIIFLCIGTVIVYTYQKFGMVTVNTAWWFFMSVLLVSPYIGSDSMELASVSWFQGFLIVSLFAYGFISYKYGIPVSEVGDYIPEYQERIAQQLRVEKEIEIARESQYKLMPLQPPVAEGFDVYGFFLPSFEVGGDYFDYVLSNDENGKPKALTMTVVDVSGKSMRAAMPAVFTSGLLLSRMKEDPPEKILSDVSDPIYNRTDKRTFITCAMAQYDLNSKIMKVANAGHCKPILKRNGVAEFVQTPEPRFPLGLQPDTKYDALEMKMKKGDVFLLYSDGLPEATNEAGVRFGFEEVPRLMERINTEKLSANEIAQEIKRTVQKFSNYQLVDDTTVICLKV